MGPGTLGSRLEQVDRDHFIGRRSELARLDAILASRCDARVVLVHGPAGIGKSALLREIARRARAAGRPAIPLARPGRGRLLAAVSGARAHDAPVLTVDQADAAIAVVEPVQRELLAGLAERAVVVFATRRPPDRAWFEGGWDRIVAEIGLGPLPGRAARLLLRRHGWGDDERMDVAVALAMGSPLALTALAAHGPDGLERGLPDAVASAIVRRIADGELSDERLPALAAASMVGIATPAMLDAVLGSGGAEAHAWLAGRTFARSGGGGVVVEPVLGRAAIRDLAVRAPRHARRLRRRAVDALHRRAVAGEGELAIELAELVDDPILCGDWSWAAGRALKFGGLEPHETEVIRTAWRRAGADGWWRALEPLLSAAPDLVTVARTGEGELVGYTIAAPSRDGAAAAADPVLGAWFEHARGHHPDGDGVIWRETVDLRGGTGPWGRSPVRASLNVAAVVRAGVANARWAYLPVPSAVAPAFAAAVGAERASGADVWLAGHRLACHVADFGPGGFLAAQRRLVTGEDRACEGADGRNGAGAFSHEAALDAIRNFDVVPLLARSPLAEGDTVAQRAAWMRRLISDAAVVAFGESPSERLLHDVLVRGYLDPEMTHELAAHELSLSRSAYFRRLHTAVDRVADVIVARAPGAPPP